MQGTSTMALATIFFVTALLGGVALQHSGFEFDQAKSAVQQFVPAVVASPNADTQWPPKLGQAYPDLTLTDMDGRRVRLSDYRGKVLIIEPIGMSCKACQAFAGGHVVGGFGGHQPQPGLSNIGEYVRTYGQGVSLRDDRIQAIQILFYGLQGDRPPTLHEARDWASHFGRFSSDSIVLFADREMIQPETRAMIPGFHLVDQQFILRSAAGNPPHQDLYRTLIPMIKKVLPAS